VLYGAIVLLHQSGSPPGEKESIVLYGTIALHQIIGLLHQEKGSLQGEG